MLKSELLELCRTHRPLPTYVVDETLYVAFTHQPRFHPDLNRGLYRERVGVILSAPIKSYHVDHRVDREKKFWLPKNFPRLTRLPRLSGPSHQIIWHRNKAQQNASYHVSKSCWSGPMLDMKNSMICWDVLRSTTICDSRAFTSWYDKMRVDMCLCALPRVQPTGCEFLCSHIYWTRFMYDLRKKSICTCRFPIFTQKCVFSNMLQVQR